MVGGIAFHKHNFLFYIKNLWRFFNQCRKIFNQYSKELLALIQLCIYRAYLHLFGIVKNNIFSGWGLYIAKGELDSAFQQLIYL